MGFWSDLFGKVKVKTVYLWGRTAGRARYDKALYEQALVRSIIDCIASHVAKAEALHVVLDDKGRIKEFKRNSPYSKLLNLQANSVMTGFDFKYKVATHREENTTALVYIKWAGMQPEAFIPIAYDHFEFVPIKGGGWAVHFTYDSEPYDLNLEDVVILRKFYNRNEVAGDGNSAVYPALDMDKASNEGLMEALTVSNKVRGLLKQKKAMLDSDDVEKNTNNFVARFEKAAKEGGIVGVDSMEEYTSLDVTPFSANATQMKELRENIMRYWRISDAILTSKYSEDDWQAFYESVIEPFLIQMGQAFTNACFTTTEKNHGNRIIFYTAALMHTSPKTKINILRETKETGELTKNERRELLGYPPVEDGDDFQVSLNYVKGKDQSKYQTGEKNEGGEEGNES
jgi:HK97 family phage portal protein